MNKIIDSIHLAFLNSIWKLERALLKVKYGEYSAAVDSEPVHMWFELSYAQYLTIPRSIMQSMPVEWQRDFVKLLEELDEKIEWRPKTGRYFVTLKDGKGRYAKDILQEYRHAPKWTNEKIKEARNE